MIPTAEQLDEWFKAGTMKRLGMGSRRACYAIPDTNLCVKCYRSDEEITEGRYPGRAPLMPLAPTVVREIKKYRFDERRNTCCSEYRYWKTLAQCLPSDLMSVFPTMVCCLDVPFRGWCIVENIIANDDGSDARNFHEVFKSAEPSERCRLLGAFDWLIGQLIDHAVRFYDPQNVLVTKGKDGSFHLRIADFEPAERTFVSIGNLSPFFVRRKVRRRFARYQRMFGIGSVAGGSYEGK